VNVLVLVSFGLVLLATILLVVGLLADNLTLIYISIAASFTAAVVLYLAFRRARPKADTDLVAPTPIPPEGAEDDFDEPAVTTITPAATTPETVVAAAEEPEAIDRVPEVDPEPVLAGATAPSAATDDWTSDDDWADDGEFDVEFPIAEYDDLSVAEIMPLLPQLYSDELGVVAERERTGKNRTAILSRLDELAATGTDADALEAVSTDEDADEAFAPAAMSATAAAEAPRNDALSTPRPAPAAPQVPSLSDDDDGFVFPIADYDQLSVDQIVPLLAQLEDDELEDVKVREAAGQGRRSVIAEIDRQLGLVDALDATSVPDDGWAEPAPAPEPAPEPDPAPAPEARPTPEPEPPASSMLAIAGYDGLTVAQIRPLLAGLSHDELRAVLDHETARDNRRTVVADIERRLGAAAPAPAARAAARPTKAPARKATKRAAAKRTTAKRAAKKAARATKKTAAPRFPIPDYDTLTVAQIRPQLAGLSEPELRQVQAREESGAGRKTILNEIASRLG
jgi:hypothetical protein